MRWLRSLFGRLRPTRVEVIDGWHCDVCGRLRADFYISVVHVPIVGMEADYPQTRRNVKYCNDRPECFNGARNLSVDVRGQ